MYKFLGTVVPDAKRMIWKAGSALNVPSVYSDALKQSINVYRGEEDEYVFYCGLVDAMKYGLEEITKIRQVMRRRRHVERCSTYMPLPSGSGIREG